MQRPQEDTPYRPPTEVNSAVRQTLYQSAGAVDQDHNVQASGGWSPHCVGDIKHLMEPQQVVRPKTTQGQPRQINTAPPYESPLLATMQPASTTPGFGPRWFPPAWHASASGVQFPPTPAPTILTPMYSRYDVPGSVQTPTAMVQGHPPLIQSPRTITPGRTGITQAPTPKPPAPTARYVPPHPTHRPPDGTHVSEFLTPTGHAQVIQQEPPTSVPDLTVVVHGAAASLPAQSSRPRGQEVRHAPLPQPHLPPDRVYATQAPNMYAPQSKHSLPTHSVSPPRKCADVRATISSHPTHAYDCDG